ncbi:hypothetical protein BLOT_011190 [Blomia tropicalis]|nr:hypothetical protein BLOT_011190 [Blomia tropicalis]
MNLANGPTTFELASFKSECESMAEDVQHPKYNIDKCIPKSKLHNAVKIWPRIEHEKDFSKISHLRSLAQKLIHKFLLTILKLSEM